MSGSRLRKHYELQEEKISIDFITDRGEYHSAHWQHDLEMIYLLNGSALLSIDGESQTLVQGEFVVIDSNRIYELSCKDSFMEIRIRVNREYLEMNAGHLAGGQGAYRYSCRRDELNEEKLGPYLKMCELFKSLTPLYITEPTGYRLMSESIILEILFHLVRHFAVPVREDENDERWKDQDRIHKILDYIEAHYAEPLSLTDVAGEFGLSREYFSRLFHKRIGIPFSQHLIRTRIAHFHNELVSTDKPVMELLDSCGITNYRQFSKLFKETYGCSPRELRRLIG